MLTCAVVGRPSRILLALVVAMTGLLVWSAGNARGATTLTVTSTADDVGNEACTNGQCPTLRDAVSQANSDTGDTIVVPALSPQPYTLTNGELNLTADMTIQGAGAKQVTISGGNNTRIFEIFGGATVNISGVTITDGNGLGDETIEGGAVYVGGGTTLNLSDSTVSNSGTFGDGGGIYDAGTLNLSGSTITGNQTVFQQVDPSGGGLYVNGTATLVNDTITANSAPDYGGGIYDSGSTTLTNVTVASNSAPDGSNLYVNDTSSGGAQNTIFSDPQGGGTNCDTSGELPPSGGNNLNSDSSDCWDPSTTQSSDQTGVDPKLGSLADNGGPTQTMALLAGSPAIDAGATVDSVTTDQRGGPRPQGAAYDIGAYEVGALVDMAITKSASPSPVTAGQPLTYTIKVTNDGPTSDPGHAVKVSDSLPGGVTFDSASASQGSCSHSGSTVTCAVGTVNKGATATVTIVVTPTAAGSVTNSASVSSSALDPNTANNSASVTTQVKAAAVAASNGSKPQAITGNATGITFTGATVQGTVNPEGAPTSYHFDYGTDTSYDPVTATEAAGSGTSSHSVSAHLTGLKPGTLYHYRIVASNSHGTVDGLDRTFRTPPRPSLHVAPNRVRPGAVVRVFGSAGACPVGDQVTLLSHAFPGAHRFAGVPAISARVRSGHGYSTTTRIPRGRASGRYLVTARCGGGNLGVSAHLTVYRPVVRPVVPKFTG